VKTVSDLVFACHSKACAPPPTGKGGSDRAAANRRAEWRGALRNTESVFDRKGYSYSIKHKPSASGKSTEWSVYRGVAGKPGTMRHAGSGRSRNPDKALDRILDIVLDAAYD
jgi:hypothetical protein